MGMSSWPVTLPSSSCMLTLPVQIVVGNSSHTPGHATRFMVCFDVRRRIKLPAATSGSQAATSPGRDRLQPLHQVICVPAAVLSCLGFQAQQLFLALALATHLLCCLPAPVMLAQGMSSHDLAREVAAQQHQTTFVKYMVCALILVLFLSLVPPCMRSVTWATG